MLSVLVISPDPAVPGGVSVFVECMKRHLRACHADAFHVGSGGKGGESAFSALRRLVAAPLQLAHMVRSGAYDVVHINPSFDAKSLIRDGLLLLALRAAGFRRILCFFHGWDFALQRRILSSPLRGFVAWVLGRAALIAVLGGDFRDGLVAMGVDPARIVVTRTMFEGSGLEEVKREAYAPPARPFILFMSRFDPEKGARELLLAFAEIAAAFPDLALVLAGDGPEAGYLRAEAHLRDLQERVMFPGYVGGAEKWRLLRDCALFALPTYYSREGLPVAILEAMGAGKPLLAGSAGALRHLLSDPENGAVLKDVTVQTVANGLRRLLSDKALAAAAAARNADIAWGTYEAKRVTAEIEDFYRKVARC